MDGLISTLAREGGGYLTAAVCIVLMVAGIKIAWALLKREWARNDRLENQIDNLVDSHRKQSEVLERVAAVQQILLDRRRTR